MAQSFNPKGPPKPPVGGGKKGHRQTPKEVVDRQEAIRKERARRGLGPKGPKTPRETAERGVKVAEERERITHAEFNRQWQAYNEIYLAYANRNASKGEAIKLINRGITRTTLAKYLATLPAFFKSDIWKANAAKYYGPARNMGMQVDKKFVAKAIANNWDPYVFQEKLRQTKGYLQSNEFKTTTAGLKLSYQKLYGTPSAEWEQEIQRAALGRWTPEQWMTKLRQDPAYKKSSEYQEKQYEFKSLLGYH